MNEVWRSYPGAPDEGTPVCAASDVPEGAARCLSLRVRGEEFPLLVLRRGGRIRGYVNACPHQYLPLNYRSATVLSADGTRLLCSAHGAAFDAESGACLSGAAESLDPVPLVEDDGGLVVVRRSGSTAQAG
ncbi:MAG: Rieske 2Fe-2S domain-containing protein [Methylobacterium frigidaeris]